MNDAAKEKRHGGPTGGAPGSTDDPAAAPTAVIGIVGINLLIATVLFLYIVFNRELGVETARKGDVPYTDIEIYQTDQEQLLTTYDWVKKDDGIVAIPIERAMAIVTDELNETARAVE